MLVCKMIKSTPRGGVVFDVFCNGVKVCYAIALSRSDNTPVLSRVPDGVFRLKRHRSKHFPISLELVGVPNRSAMLIHPGNVVGDMTIGMKTHSHGCTLPVSDYSIVNGVVVGYGSKVATARLVAMFNSNFFSKLKVQS